MRSTVEIEKLRDLLGGIVDTLTEYGTEEEVGSFAFAYLCNVVDALNWVLGEITTENFLSNSYLDVDTWMKRKVELKEDFL